MGIPVHDPRWKVAAQGEPKKEALAKGWGVLVRTLADLNKFGPHLYAIREHVSTEDYAMIRSSVTNIGNQIIQLQDALEKMGDLV